MSKVKFNGDIETVGLITDQVTISNPDGDAIVLDTEAWKKVKEVVDAPYSFTFFPFADVENVHYPYFDLDFRSFFGYGVPIDNSIVNIDWVNGVMTFVNPIITFPPIFHEYCRNYWNDSSDWNTQLLRSVDVP